MIAQNRAPGLLREFAAEKWHFLAPSLWEQAREEARDSVKNIPIDIMGSDIDPRSIDLCKKHAKKAGVMLKWAVAPVQDFKETAERGVIACNPPYGERMLDKKQTQQLYRDMRFVFEPLTGWRVNIITAMQEFERVYGKRADKRRKLSNGGMTCTLYQYMPPRIRS